MDDFRIGHGYDVHRLAENRALIIGGINIPYKKGLLGHSDADVLIHAVMDAIIGALGEGDIGKHFPDTDIAYKDIRSTVLLEKCAMLMQKKGFSVVNLDATVIAQAPKLSPYIEDMRRIVANTLSADITRINIKATTEEKLGFTGNGEGISAHCVVLLKQTR